jgi:metal-responsive CopG/Arc/MetJ family transcriptional regulator
MKRENGKAAHAQRTPLVRASISFPPDLYEALEEISKRKKVSLAWVVRDAAEQYLADETERGGKEHTQTAHVAGKLTRGAR